MPTSRPLATDLLAIVQEYLETQVSPLLPTVQQFQLKIVSRVLMTVRRELQNGPEFDAAETGRLATLLRRDGTLEQLNAELARAIRAGELATDDPTLLAHLRASVEDALRINNPKWLPKSAP